jgi:hypothetical protein
MEISWKPKFDSIPIACWKKRASKISLNNKFSALIGYEQLAKDISYIESVIEGAAMSLDGHIQQQIDIARGK